MSGVTEDTLPPPGELELEVRIGMLTEGELRRMPVPADGRFMVEATRSNAPGRGVPRQQAFASQTTHRSARQLCEYLESRGCIASETRTVTSPGGEGLRRICFAATAETPAHTVVQRKSRMCATDWHVQSGMYDMRMAVSREEEVSGVDVWTGSGDGAEDRHRERQSYTKGCWQVDISEVTTNETDACHMEIEFEMTAVAAMCIFDEGALAVAAAELAEMLGQVLQPECLPGAQSWHLKPMSDTDAEVQNQIGMVLSGLVQGQKPQRFTAAQCVAMRREHVHRITRGVKRASCTQPQYYISEKTDGERFQLLVDSNEEAIFMNRRGQLCGIVVPNSRGVVTDVPNVKGKLPPGTILDGEVVFSRTLRMNVFQVFDILMLRGKSLVGDSFAHRWCQLRSVMKAYYKAIGSSSQVVRLIHKRWKKIKDAMSVLQNLCTDWDGAPCYEATSGALPVRHRIDGLILQPDQPYTCGTHHDLLKFKEEPTVDLSLD